MKLNVLIGIKQVIYYVLVLEINLFGFGNIMILMNFIVLLLLMHILKMLKKQDGFLIKIILLVVVMIIL